MMRKKIFIFFLFFVSFLVLSTKAYTENFKNYAIGYDSTYTIGALFYSGLGVGIYTEIGFWGLYSFEINVGYKKFNWMNDSGEEKLSKLLYASAGFRFYFSYDAIGGPFFSTLLGIRSATVNEENKIEFIMPIGIGWKFIIDNYSGFFAEPLFRVVLYPFYDRRFGISANFELSIGADIGFAF